MTSQYVHDSVPKTQFTNTKFRALDQSRCGPTYTTACTDLIYTFYRLVDMCHATSGQLYRRQLYDPRARDAGAQFRVAFCEPFVMSPCVQLVQQKTSLQKRESVFIVNIINLCSGLQRLVDVKKHRSVRCMASAYASKQSRYGSHRRFNSDGLRNNQFSRGQGRKLFPTNQNRFIKTES
jgi:hypothetical protein